MVEGVDSIPPALPLRRSIDRLLHAACRLQLAIIPCFGYEGQIKLKKIKGTFHDSLGTEWSVILEERNCLP